MLIRRQFLRGAGGVAIAGSTRLWRGFADARQPEHAIYSDLETPFKYGSLILEKSGLTGRFDSELVDGSFVFRHDGHFFMTYLGHDGRGYQTGLATSADLVQWHKQGLIFARRPCNPWLRTNAALTSILKEDELRAGNRLKKVNGRYLATWHAYPGEGYEVGAAVIGLAWSDDLVDWEPTEPILHPEDGADWEKGGLYRSYLMSDGKYFYIFYNAKNKTVWPWREQWGVAVSRDLKHWRRYPGNPLVRNGSRGSPDEIFASDPFVVRSGGRWVAYYFGLAEDQHARDLVAIGNNPFSFRKIDRIMINVGPPGSIDSEHAHKPAIISSNGNLYHFYTAVSSDGQRENRGISVARSNPW